MRREGSRKLSTKPGFDPRGCTISCPHVCVYAFCLCVCVLSLKCPKNHEHVKLVGGWASAAREYPKGLCEAICRGLAAQKAVDRSRRFITLPLASKRIGSLSLLCCEAPGGLGNHDWPGAVETPVCSYPVNWTDGIHDHDGHLLRPAPGDRSGRGDIDRRIRRSYGQPGFHLPTTTSPTPTWTPSLFEERVNWK